MPVGPGSGGSLEWGHDVPGPDLFVVCKQCGSEVSPYITECPYCGARLRSRAPKLPRVKGRDRGLRRLTRLGAVDTSRRAHGRPPRTGASCTQPRARVRERTRSRMRRSRWSRPAARAGWLCEADTSASTSSRSSVHWTATGGSCCPARSPTVDGLYAFVALLATAIFGWLLERRHGPAIVLVVFFGGAVSGALVASAVYSAPIVSGAGAAALALIVAWSVPDLQAARRGRLLRGRAARRRRDRRDSAAGALRPSGGELAGGRGGRDRRSDPRHRPASDRAARVLRARSRPCSRTLMMVLPTPSPRPHRRRRDHPRHRSSDDMEIRFLGHAAFELSDGDTSVLIDPFLTGNPKAAVAAEDLSPQAILLTHGHVDHIGDTVPIAKRAGSDVVAIVEIANELSGDGVEHVHDPNLGGTVDARLGLGQARAGLAHLDDSERHGQHAGRADRAVRGQDDLPPRRHGAVLRPAADRRDARRPIDVALMCIGGHYTMDRHDAVAAAQADRRQAGDSVPLRHVPADRDRRAGVQGRGRVGRRVRGGRARARGAHTP